MALTLTASAHSEVGLVRKNNQDSAYASATMLMVADGMGGAAAGDLASAVAVHELRRTDERLAELLAEAGSPGAVAPPSPPPAARGPGGGARNPPPPGAHAAFVVLADALARANDEIARLVDEDAELDGMGTTVCGLVLGQDEASLVNIGDSRAYLLRDGVLRRLTHDHSWVQTLVDEGRITEEEALEHPHRSLILRVLNGSPAHVPDFHVEPLQAGDRLMVCSDGLCGLVTDALMLPPLKLADRDAALAALVALAHAAGGHDNITIILADVETDGPVTAPRVLGAAETTAVPSAPEHTLSFEGLDEASLMDPTATGERALTEDERYALLARRRPGVRVRILLGFLIPVLVVLGGGAAWYAYAQTRFFVGATPDEVVAVYRGVPDRVLGVPLSSLVQTDTTRLGDLPPYYADRVRRTIPVDGLDEAQLTLEELRGEATQCIKQREARARATTTPKPTPTPRPAPSPTVSPAGGLPVPAGSATPTPSPTPTPTPATYEDC